MMRFFNFLVLVVLMASATWAYSVKYETILVAENLRHLQSELVKQREAIAFLQVEWQILNNPQRLKSLVKPENGQVFLSARQMAHVQDLPMASSQTIDPLDALLTTGGINAFSSPENGTGMVAPRSSGLRSQYKNLRVKNEDKKLLSRASGKVVVMRPEQGLPLQLIPSSDPKEKGNKIGAQPSLTRFLQRLEE